MAITCAWTSPEINQQSAVGLPVVAKEVQIIKKCKNLKKTIEVMFGLPPHSNLSMLITRDIPDSATHTLPRTVIFGKKQTQSASAHSLIY